jgi:hypothetical protein
MPFFSPMAARMPVRRVANEGVTTERAILLRKEIVIHFGPASTLEIKAEIVRGSREEFKNWRAVRAGQRLACAGAQNLDPDTRPCEWQTCFPLPKYLPRSGDLRFGHSHCAMCRGATAQRARSVTGQRCPDRMSRHRRSSNWARISASFAASTGSRDRAEQRLVLSQEDAAGS